MDTDISNAELARRLDDFASGIREDFAEVRDAFKLYLPREVYEARHAALKTQLEREHQGLTADVDELKRRAAEGENQRRADRKWVVGVIVIPIALFIAQLLISMNGGGPA